MADETTEPVKSDDAANPAAGDKATRGRPAKQTRAQAAKVKAAEVAKATEVTILSQEPSYTVGYPTGISLYVPDADTDEISVQVQGQQVWIDVENGFAHVPTDATVTAKTLEQAATFQRLAGQGLLRRVVDPT